MKKLMIIFAVSMVTTLHAKTFDSAIEYNNYLINEQKTVIAKIGEVTDILIADKFNEKAAWKAHKALQKQCDKSIINVEKTDAYANAIDFKNSMLDLLKCYEEFANNGFKEVINIYCQDYRSDDDIKRVGDILETFDIMEQLNLLLFEYAQADFANQNNFTVAQN